MEENNNTPETIGNDTPSTPVPESEAVSQSVEEVVAEVIPEEVATMPVVSQKNIIIRQYAIAGIIVLIIGLGLWYVLEMQGRVQTGVFDKITSMMTPTPAAAVVNGVAITLADYEKNREQLVLNATQQGLDPEEASIAAEIKTQAVDVLVNTELLRQGATAAGVTVTGEQVDARYQEIIDGIGGEEALIARMTELNITTDALRKDIEGEILIKAFLTESVDTSGITIEDAEIEAIYAQAGGAGAELPPLEEVREEIATQLRFNKEQELVNAFIQTLRDEATIEILI